MLKKTYTSTVNTFNDFFPTHTPVDKGHAPPLMSNPGPATVPCRNMTGQTVLYNLGQKVLIFNFESGKL